MNRREFLVISAAVGLCRRPTSKSDSYRIDRAALVKRHCPLLTEANVNSPLQVGNGDFAFTADVTGLQTFPEEYLKGVPLGTFSNWGWHSFPNPDHYQLSDIMRSYDSHGQEVPYADGWGVPGHSSAPAHIQQAVEWLRRNPHRIDLARIGFLLRRASGDKASLADIAGVHQQLNLLHGRLESRFEFENLPVRVTTLCHPGQSMLAARISSPLISIKRMGVLIAFPYASGDWQVAAEWNSPGKYQTKITQSESRAIFECVLDDTRYWVRAEWTGKNSWAEVGPHRFELFAPDESQFELIISFSPEPPLSASWFRADPGRRGEILAGLLAQWRSGRSVRKR